MTRLTRIHTVGTCVSGETAFPLDHAWACRPGTREQRATRCGRASQPWEQTCLLREQGSPQRTVQGSRATVDAVSHLGLSDKDRGLGVTGMSRKGHTWPAGRGGLSAVRRVLSFPPSCAHECVRAPCSRVWCPALGRVPAFVYFPSRPVGLALTQSVPPDAIGVF